MWQNNIYYKFRIKHGIRNKARRFVDLRQKISWKGQIPIRMFLTIYNCYCRIAYVYNESLCRVYHLQYYKNSIMKRSDIRNYLLQQNSLDTKRLSQIKSRRAF